MRNSYFSWIPTTNGRLSFSLASAENGAACNNLYTNLASDGRFFVSIREKKNSDYTIPFFSNTSKSRAFLENAISGNWSNTYYLVYFKVNQDYEKIKGTIVLFSPVNWVLNLESILALDRSLPKPLDDNFRLDDHFNSIKPLSISSVSFILKRNGTILLNCDFIENKTSEILMKYGENPSEYLASNAYYNIREIFHTHRYHSANSDTIINVYKNRWRNKINFALSRKIISLRKNGDPDSLEKALGVMTYLESFRQNVMRPKEINSHKFSSDIMKEAIQLDLQIVSKRVDKNFLNLAQKTLQAVAIGIAGIASYLKINYEVSLATLGKDVDLFHLQNLWNIKSKSFEKTDYIAYYLQYTDDLLTLATILFVSSFFLRFKFEYIINTNRDIIRIAIAKPKLVKYVSLLLFILCTLGVLYFSIISI